MSHESTRIRITSGRTLYVRLSAPLNDALQRAADRESNTPSAVARRLISLGLQREAADREHDDEPHG